MARDERDHDEIGSPDGQNRLSEGEMMDDELARVAGGSGGGKTSTVIISA